jgi:hypothetical protein
MPPDPALLDRTLASIRSNFESLRRFDPIPALMAESPPGPREEFGSGKSPVPPVSAFSHPNCRRLVSSSILEDGEPVLGRDLWVVASEPSVARLRLAAEAAAGFTTVLRESVGIPKSRANSALNHWFWTVFEVAAATPPYSVLRLKGGGVFRMAEGGIIQASESELEEFDKRGAPSDPLEAAFLCRPYSPVRYWELKDFVEASLWALDLVAVALPAVIERERGNPGTSRDALLETVETPKPGRSHKRTVDNLTVNQWVVAMAAKDRGFRNLSEREAAELGPFGARTVGTCEMWVQMKADLEREMRENADRAAEELADRQSEDEDANGLRLSSTKSGIGRQRTAPEDLEQERNVRAFLRSKGEQPGRGRAK